MDTERAPVPAVRPALAAACPALADGTAADAVAGVVPSFVASPSSTAEVAALLRAAAAAGLAVVPRGAGTGLTWGAPPSRCDLVVDLRSMDQVLEHAAGDLVARVQAGATIGHLAVALGSAGQQLALDAPAAATVGGVGAAAGSRLVRAAGELDWPGGSQRPLRVGVLLEGTGPGVAERSKQMSELLALPGGVISVAETAPARWGALPGSVTVVRVSF